MIFIAGGGFYGTKALLSLKHNNIILVADIDENCMASKYVDCIMNNLREYLEKKEDKCHTTLLISDSVKLLNQLFKNKIIPSTIIPTTPFHLAGEVVKLYLSEKNYRIFSSSHIYKIIEIVKNYGFETKIDFRKTAVISYMPFNKLCIPNCLEPLVCPVTNKIRITPLYEILKTFLSNVTDMNIVLVSKFIADGVGGYRGLDLFNFLIELDKNNKKDRYLVGVATACSCHGLTDILQIEYN